MNPTWKLRVLVAFTFASCPVLTSAANCPSGQKPAQSTKTQVANPQGKSPLKWKPPTYRGLILGKSNKSDVEAILGRPRWSGNPEEPAFEPTSDRELWYEYNGADGSPGRTTVVMNHIGVVVVILVYPDEPLPLRKAVELYGKQYVEKKWNPCLTERELSQMRDKASPPLDTFLVYPAKGMYLQVGDYGSGIEVIGYLLRCL